MKFGRLRAADDRPYIGIRRLADTTIFHFPLSIFNYHRKPLRLESKIPATSP